MAEYIEREAAVKAANEWVSEACMASVMRVSRLFDKLQKVPAADVAPVVRSRWRYCGFLLECQSCGEIYSRHGGNAGKLWNYCPNCGAKMDGGDGDAAD